MFITVDVYAGSNVWLRPLRCGSRAGKQLLRSVTSEGWAGHVVEGNLRSNVSEMGNGGKEGGSGVIEVRSGAVRFGGVPSAETETRNYFYAFAG